MHCTASPASGMPTKTAPRRAARRGWLATALAVAVAIATIVIAVAVAAPAEAAATATREAPHAAAAAADDTSAKTLLVPSVRADNYARCGSRYDRCTEAVRCHDNSTSGCTFDARKIANICCSCYRPCKASGRRIYRERCRTRALRFGYTC